MLGGTDTVVEVDVDLTTHVPCVHHHRDGPCQNPATLRVRYACGCTELLCEPCLLMSKWYVDLAVAAIAPRPIEIRCDTCFTVFRIWSFAELVRSEDPL
jgi:hypothetical protein